MHIALLKSRCHTHLRIYNTLQKDTVGTMLRSNLKQTLKRVVLTSVVNIQQDDYDIFIGRGGQWGNPFIMGVDGTREEVIEKYRQWIMTQPQLLTQLPTLKGKRLGCYCKPLACHGDILCELVEELK